MNSLWIETDVLEGLNERMAAKYADAEHTQIRCHEYRTHDAELILVAYGSPARICKTAVDMARDEGLRVGMLRPITLLPFPSPQIADLARNGKRFLTVELSRGQMVEDVRLAVNGLAEVAFYGRTGGAVPTPSEILENIRFGFGKASMVLASGKEARE